MRDRRLEKNVMRVEAFIERWKALSRFLDRGAQGDDFTGEEEGAFLDLKSEIIREAELLKVTLGSEVDRDDRVLRLLNSVPSLRSFQELTDETVKRLSTDWHTSYLGLQALLGRLKGRQVQLASVSSFRLGVRKVFTNPLMVLLVAVAAAYGVYKFSVETIPKIIERGR